MVETMSNDNKTNRNKPAQNCQKIFGFGKNKIACRGNQYILLQCPFFLQCAETSKTLKTKEKLIKNKRKEQK